MTQNNGNYVSMSFKATDFSTDGEPVCDFLLVSDTNLCPLLHRFQAIVQYWPSIYHRQGVPLFNVNVISWK